MFVREDNTYTFIVKEKECSVQFEDKPILKIGEHLINFKNLQELILFTNYLTDVLDDVSETKRGNL